MSDHDINIVITEVWKADRLGRREEAQQLIGFLKAYRINKPGKSMVLNLDAEWGFGKSYMLKCMYEQLKHEGVPCAYYDAWSNDFSKEAMISFVLEIKSSLAPFLNKNVENMKRFDKVAMATMKIVAKGLSKTYLGIGEDELEDISSIEIDDNITDEVAKTIDSKISGYSAQQDDLKTTIKVLRSTLETIANSYRDQDDNPLPLIILVDELDRCRPNYAIELLESIKHIFETTGVYFVIATDTKQLIHAFKAVYGPNYDTARYLKRFFNLEYRMNKPDGHLYAGMLVDEHVAPFTQKLLCQTVNPEEDEIDIIWSSPKTYALAYVLSEYAKAFDLSYRDQEQCVEILEAIMLLQSRRPKKVHYLYMLFLIMIKHKSNETLAEIDYKLKTMENFSNATAIFEEIFSKYGVYFDFRHNMLQGHTENARQENRISIMRIISFYTQNMNKEIQNFTRRQSNRSIDIEKFIDGSIQQEYNRNTTNAFKKPLIHLLEYPKLINMAARYSDE